MFAPGHHGYPRASRLTSGKASKAKLAPSLVVAPGRPFVHLFIPSRRLGGKAIDIEILGLRLQLL